MARPKKHVRIIEVNGEYQRADKKTEGREIHGLHYNRANNMYYYYVDGKVTYLSSDLRKALQKFGLEENPITATEVRDMAKALPNTNPKAIRALTKEVMVNLFDSTSMTAIQGAYRRSKGLITEEKAVPRGVKRLTDALKVYRDFKIKGNKGIETNHLKNVVRVFKQFIKVVGNQYIAQLEFNHFKKWHRWVTKESLRRESSKWPNDQNSHIKAVIKYSKKKTMDWPWPVEVVEWAGAYDREAYSAADENKEPMPIEVFRAFLKAADERKNLRPDLIDTSTRSGMGTKQQVLRSQREGVQIKAAMLLGVNAGFDPVDFGRLTTVDLHLDGPMPYVDLPRSKVKKTVGKAIKRRCPLLPITVDALKAWMDYEVAHDGSVFRNCRKGVYTKDVIGQCMERLREDAGSICDGWSFKHLRNVGASLGRHVLPDSLLDAFLGHTNTAILASYTGQQAAEKMLPVVELIDREYLSKLENVT